MTDLKIKRLCAEAMGLEHAWNSTGEVCAWPNGQQQGLRYDPLHDDAQAMALGKSNPELFEQCVSEWSSMIRCGEKMASLNRVICETFAKRQYEQKAR